MPQIIFSYDDFHHLIEDFASEIPELLKNNNLTSRLSYNIENLLDVKDMPFTLAIVGQMRAGKSTLLNSLIGEDLAVTGVNETTATINWFKYGSKQECNKFRVNWKGKPSELFPLQEIENWTGDAAKATDTRSLEFYSQSKYLKEANIVDTPGTRSIIVSHEEKINDFLSNKNAADTMKEGGNADAILYVIMPVARETDSEMLADFDKNTRIPGSSPYNSIAVVHKWEMLDANDPFDEVKKKVVMISKTMKDKVSLVIPYSAPMAIAVSRFDDKFWDSLALLIKGTDYDDLEDLIEADTYFLDDDECSLSVDERKYILENYDIPWRTLHTIIKVGMNKNLETPTKLKEYVREMSGIDLLNKELQKRFFARSKMIKMFSVLSKAWEPCQIAQTKLRVYKNELAENITNNQYVLELLENRVENGDAPLKIAIDYIQNSKTSIDDAFRKTAITLKKIGEVSINIKDAFDNMNNDIKMIDIIENNLKNIDENTCKTIKYILGYYGSDITSRLSYIENFDIKNRNIDCLEDELENFIQLATEFRGEEREVLKHTATRLEDILNIIDRSDLL